MHANKIPFTLVMIVFALGFAGCTGGSSHQGATDLSATSPIKFSVVVEPQAKVLESSELAPIEVNAYDVLTGLKLNAAAGNPESDGTTTLFVDADRLSAQTVIRFEAKRPQGITEFMCDDALAAEILTSEKEVIAPFAIGPLSSVAYQIMLDSGGGACSQSAHSDSIAAICVQCLLINVAVQGLRGEDSTVGRALQTMVAIATNHSLRGSQGGWDNTVSLLQQAMDGKKDALSSALELAKLGEINLTSDDLAAQLNLASSMGKFLRPVTAQYQSAFLSNPTFKTQVLDLVKAWEDQKDAVIISEDPSRFFPLFSHSAFTEIRANALFPLIVIEAEGGSTVFGNERLLDDILFVGKETLAGQGLTREELEKKWTTLIEVSKAVLSLVPESLNDDARQQQLFDIVGRPPQDGAHRDQGDDAGTKKGAPAEAGGQDAADVHETGETTTPSPPSPLPTPPETPPPPAESLKIIGRSPMPNETAVVGQTVLVNFNEEIDAATLNQIQLLREGTAVPGSWSFMTDTLRTILKFTPTDPLQQGASYTLRVGRKLKSTTGHTLEAETTWTFQTEGAPPEPPPPLSNDTPIATGFLHACALRNDGRVLCWGDNFFGQLGRGTVGDPADSAKANFVKLKNGSDLTRVVQLAASFHSTFALRDDGTVVGWGRSGADGALGHGVDPGNQYGDNARFTSVPYATVIYGTTRPLNHVTALAVGSGHACVIADNRVKCWGAGPFGETGDPLFPNRVLTATDITGFQGNATPLQLALGDGYSCVLMSDGQVQCWGWNANGALGRGPNGWCNSPDPFCKIPTPNYVVVQLTNAGYDPSDATTRFTEVEEIWAKATTTCARRRDQSVYCWGPNPGGISWNGINIGTAGVATEIAGLQGLDVISNNSYFACGLDKGQVGCWGTNYADIGNLGIGSSAQQTVTVFALPEIDAPAVAVDVPPRENFAFACAALDDSGGHVACWGNNAYGQLGDGTKDNRPSPIRVLTNDDTPLQLKVSAP